MRSKSRRSPRPAGEGGARVAKRRGRVRALDRPFGKHFRNRLDHALDVPKHLMVPEPDHAIAASLEKSGTVRIDFFTMLPAIDLDDELVAKAEEVGIERSDNGLTPELRLRQLLAQAAP